MTQQELELPKGWIVGKLEDAAYFQEGPGLRRYQYAKHGIPFLNIRAFENGKINKNKCNFIKKEEFENRYEHFLLNEGDIVVSSSGTIGKSVIVTEDVLPLMLNTSVIRFRTRYSELLLQTFLRIYLSSQHFLIQINSEKTGSTISNYGPTHLKKVNIILPPINEQKRIVSKIGELFSKIDSIKQSLEHTKLQLEHYRFSFLRSFFGSIDNTVRLEQCSVIGTGGTPSRKNPEYYNGNIPWVKTAEVQNSHIKFTSEKITELGRKNSNAKIHPKNSVILAMYGEGHNRGKCAILDIDASTNQACAVIVCDPQKLFYEFCFYWFQSQYHQMRLKSSGGNQPNLNLGIVKKTEIPLPTLEEQEQIVSQIEQGFSLIENSQRIVNSTLQTLETMRMSVLKQAFQGKLVTQDPNDEPASVLLERIKKEKLKNRQ